jgi:glycosyltransferase involved in cell wall biosynthesis
MNANISILMSVFNNRGGLHRTVESVLGQSYGDFEFIIVDDGSNEETYATIAHYGKLDNRIQIIRNQNNLGLSRALNFGISHAKSQWIARIDEGDEWLVNKLEKQYRVLSENSELVILGTQTYFFSDGQNDYKKTAYPETDEKIRRSFICGNNCFINSTVLFRNFSGLSYNENLNNAEDYELWLRLAFLGKMANINETLVRYHITRNNMSFGGAVEQRRIARGVYCYFTDLLRRGSVKEIKRFVSGKNDYRFAKSSKDSFLKIISAKYNWLSAVNYRKRNVPMLLLSYLLDPSLVKFYLERNFINPWMVEQSKWTCSLEYLKS